MSKKIKETFFFSHNSFKMLTTWAWIETSNNAISSLAIIIFGLEINALVITILCLWVEQTIAFATKKILDL